MPKIENLTILKHATPIAAILSARGDSWSAEASAAVVVKVVLEEMGSVEQLGDEFKEDRKAVIALVKQFFTAGKNYQNSYLAPTGLMPEVKGEKKVDAEFA